MRILIRVVVGVLLLAVLALGLVWIFQGSLIKAAIQSGGTYATGVETRVDGVSAGLLGGQLELEGVSIANPPGFSAEPFFALRSAKADWDTRSLLESTIHVREFELDGLALRIERNASGTNYSAILDHVASVGSGGAATKPAPSETAGEQRALVVDRIVIKDVSAVLVLSDLPVATGPLSVTVPRLEITNFRSDGPTHEVIGQLLSAIVEAALDASLKAGDGIFPADLTRDLKAKLKDAQSVLDAALKGDVQGSIEGADKALKGLKGVFGGKK